MEQEANEAARDLWSQIFERAAAHPEAAIMDPAYDPRDEEERIRAGFAAAGWAADHIDGILAAGVKRNAGAPVTSPGANPSAELLHGILCDAVEAEMKRQGHASQQMVAHGIEPVAGPFAAKAGVIMTEQSIITVGAFTFRFCGILAKAFHRTIMLDAGYWQFDQYSEGGARRLLLSDKRLVFYWHRIFMSFAMTGTNVMVPFQPSSPSEIHLVEQVARAMEIFIIAHEYGHHHHGHGRDIKADPRREEFAADQFALTICRPIGEQERSPTWNPYLASGAGGVIVLKALEILRHFEQTFGAKMPTGQTHPSADERIAKFASVAVMEPALFGTLKGFRAVGTRVMDTVGALLVEFLGAIPDADRRALIDFRRKTRAQAL